ncbi:hypothetical protein FRC04_006731 [Tulasnella sp. 424]|nr:hypothetical protein FRC04_006731 [Tulasnella sp. 424]KAG8970502.1 hypothetical protein FRC05_000610 [Tulasnella sp. 425]
MSKVGSFHLAIVTPARENDVTHLRSTKRERDNEDGDGNGSKGGAKRPKYRKDISLDDPNPRRKGILKDPRRKVSVSNRKRRVRWAERLEDHNYPNEFKGIKTVRQSNPGVKFVHEAHGGNWDASYVSDALPEGLRDRPQNIHMSSPALVSTYQENQRSSGSDFTAIPTGDWFSTFLKTLSEKEIHDLLAAYESLHQLVLPVDGVPGHGSAASPPSAISELPPTAASGSEGHGSTTLDWRFGIVNGIVLQSPQLPGGLSGERVLPAILPNQDQAVPDLSTSPDLSDHSLTPPSPALNRFDVAMDEGLNLILPGGEHVGEGLDAKAVRFSEDPTRSVSFTSARHCGSNLGLPQRGGSGMGFEDRGNRPTPRTPGAPLEKKHDMENEYSTLAAKRITSSASMGKARKEGQSDSTKKLLGPNRTAS